ncbi:hypothetical protein ACM66B_003281 [Microbotryomycetes sp. NB124-2]
MQVDNAPAYSILRIKRKRTANEQPLEALIIGDGHEPSVKRRRQSRPRTDDDEHGARQRRQAGVFHFAQTIAVTSFDDEVATRQLQSRISAALQAGPTSPPTTETQPDSNRSTPTQQQQATTERTRLRVINIRKRPSAVSLRQPFQDAPPVVRSHKDMASKPPPEASAGPSRIYDAIIDTGETSNGHSNIVAQPEDDMMSNFVPMLEEFLSMQDNVLARSLPPSATTTAIPPAAPPSKPADNAMQEDDDSDYVYDVYYRDLREQNSLENASVGAAGYDVSKLAGLTRIGEIAGLDDFEEVLTAQVSSEEEDEADEDSNEENDYRNEYPDEDAESEDEDYEYE